jgi:citrate lyase alpha subunit
MAADEPEGSKPPGRPMAGLRHTRRLTDKILIAFHHACDQGDFEVAEEMLRILEMMLTRRTVSPDTNRRKNMESLVAAHERLWLLRHPESRD